MRALRRHDLELPPLHIHSIATGALALGALAIGALAIGALVIGRLRILRIDADKVHSPVRNEGQSGNAGSSGKVSKADVELG